eukprot:jgi/Tetstr1/446722/TSEL_034210.t1
MAITATAPSARLLTQTSRRARARPASLKVRSQARRVEQSAPVGFGRREALTAATGAALLLGGSGPALAKDDKNVGAYLPVYEEDSDLVLFVPGPRETPAIRAGTIDPKAPYRFALPPKWHRDPVANISSGNYCQPNCAEPWTEVIFSGAEGRAQVIISPLVRLINKSNASLSEIGPPEGLINSFGPYITGTYVEDDDVLSSSSCEKNGRLYYTYELYAPYGTMPPHGLAVLTTKGDAAILFAVNATDKQWGSGEALLHKVIDSFTV